MQFTQGSRRSGLRYLREGFVSSSFVIRKESPSAARRPGRPRPPVKHPGRLDERRLGGRRFRQTDSECHGEYARRPVQQESRQARDGCWLTLTDDHGSTDRESGAQTSGRQLGEADGGIVGVSTPTSSRIEAHRCTVDRWWIVAFDLPGTAHKLINDVQRTWASFDDIGRCLASHVRHWR